MHVAQLASGWIGEFKVGEKAAQPGQDTVVPYFDGRGLVGAWIGEFGPWRIEGLEPPVGPRRGPEGLVMARKKDVPPGPSPEDPPIEELAAEADEKLPVPFSDAPVTVAEEPVPQEVAVNPLSVADWQWLKGWDATFSRLTEDMLGKRGDRRGRDPIQQATTSLRLDKEYPRLKNEASLLEMVHRDRLVGTPVYKDEKSTETFKAMAAERRARLDVLLTEPPPPPEPVPLAAPLNPEEPFKPPRVNPELEARRVEVEAMAAKAGVGVKKVTVRAGQEKTT